MKISNCDLIKRKLLHSKGNHEKDENTTLKWEKKSQMKQLMHFSIGGKKIEFKNEEEELNKHFSKEDIDG